jgi:hypothetical protein
MPKRRFGWTKSDVTIKPLSDRQQAVVTSLPADEVIAAKQLQAMVKSGKITRSDLTAIISALGDKS